MLIKMRAFTIETRTERRNFQHTLEKLMPLTLVALVQFKESSISIHQTNPHKIAASTVDILVGHVDNGDPVMKTIFLPSFLGVYKKSFQKWTSVTMEFDERHINFRASFGTNYEVLRCDYHERDREFCILGVPGGRFPKYTIESGPFFSFLNYLSVLSAPDQGVLHVKASPGCLRFGISNAHSGTATFTFSFGPDDIHNTCKHTPDTVYEQDLFLVLLIKIRALLVCARVFTIELLPSGMMLSVKCPEFRFMSYISGVDTNDDCVYV